MKKLKRLNAPEDIVNPYKDAKYAFLDKSKKKCKAYKNGELKKSKILEWIRSDRLVRLKTEQPITELL